ncbi:MAG: MATE family efflux transporter [Oscillospiraceae bacterium]|nr:MATE family efflux transporter [Oscillospiraceae bacterium]
MRIRLSDHFTYPRLLRFVLPSIVMMIFTSIYSVVDGLFVSNFAGKIPFAAINLIYPLLMILGALGFMIGTGGSAIVGKTLGEGDPAAANRYFSLLVYAAMGGGVLLALLGELFLQPVAVMLGARGEILENCVLYGRIILAALPFFILQNVFQSFFVTAEKPKLGLAATVAAGCSNILLDALFVAGFGWGLAGAALATALCQAVGGVIPLLYFSRRNDSLLRLGRTQFQGRILLQTCFNGSSELMSSIAASVVTILYNYQLMRLTGEDGVAAFGVVMYISFVFAAIFIGYSIGGAPLFSYHFGAENRAELQNLLRKSLLLMGAIGAAMTLAASLLADPISRLFVGYDSGLYDLTVHGIRVYSFVFLLCGFNIFGSGFFTALNNGMISASISFLRTLVFETSSVLILPWIFGMDGIWGATIAAETAALLITTAFFLANRKRYHYF